MIIRRGFFFLVLTLCEILMQLRLDASQGETDRGTWTCRWSECEELRDDVANDKIEAPAICYDLLLTFDISKVWDVRSIVSSTGV